MKLPFAEELFAILICPVAKVPLKFTGDQLVSTDAQTRRAYPIDGDLPIMLQERSTVLSEADWATAMKNGKTAEELAAQ